MEHLWGTVATLYGRLVCLCLWHRRLVYLFAVGGCLLAQNQLTFLGHSLPSQRALGKPPAGNSTGPLPSEPQPAPLRVAARAASVIPLLQRTPPLPSSIFGRDAAQLPGCCVLE